MTGREEQGARLRVASALAPVTGYLTFSTYVNAVELGPRVALVLTAAIVLWSSSFVTRSIEDSAERRSPEVRVVRATYTVLTAAVVAVLVLYAPWSLALTPETPSATTFVCLALGVAFAAYVAHRERARVVAA